MDYPVYIKYIAFEQRSLCFFLVSGHHAWVNYRVSWFIGPAKNQAQVRIGILENKVLSIGYMDASGQDFGVVSIKVIDNKTLKGKWSSLFSNGGFGEEEFTFESEKVPEDLKPQAPKERKNI